MRKLKNLFSDAGLHGVMQSREDNLRAAVDGFNADYLLDTPTDDRPRTTHSYRNVFTGFVPAALIDW